MPTQGYVVHIFPPCEFTNAKLASFAPDNYKNIVSMTNMLIIVVTTVHNSSSTNVMVH